MKRLIIGLLAIALAIGLYFYLKKDKYSTVDEKAVAFAVEDPATISKIEMRDRDGNEVILKKKDGQWWVNDEYPGFEPIINEFLNNTLAKVKVKGPVPSAARDNVIRSMVGTAVKVSIYSDGEMIRSYYVGGPNQNHTGTYMHVEGSGSPYIAYVPGQNGFITPRFSLVKENWFDRRIFDFESEEIKSVDLIYRDQPEESFTLERNGNEYSISPEIAGETINQVIARSYFALFKFKNFEGFPEYLTEQVKDSIMKSHALITITVHPVKGKPVQLNVFEKGHIEDKTLVDKKGNIIAYDPERYFATYTGFSKMVTIQDYVFGKIFARRSEFYGN